MSMITATKNILSVFQQPDNETNTVEMLLQSIDEENMFQGISLDCSLRDRIVLFKIRRDFVTIIKSEFDQRFPAEDMAILKDLNLVLNPSLLPQRQQAIVEHGVENLVRILNFYGNILNRQDTRNNHLHFKFLLNDSRNLNLQNMFADFRISP